MRRSAIVALTAWWLMPSLAGAQQMFIYPQKGQSAAQQQRDEGECHTWAVNQSGFNPGMAGTPSSGRGDGRLVRGAARGAAAGAAIGAIAGDAGKGAAAGAAGGALIGGMRRRGLARQQESAHAAGQQSYQRAFATCMQGRAYTVN